MHLKDLKLFKGKKSNILSALTLNDAVYWGADLFVATIFAFYVTQNIEGGSATHVGIMFAVYRIIRAFIALPLGRFFDIHKGQLDEVWALALSGALVGIVYMALFFASSLWQVYLAMVFIGIGHALNIGSWTVLFYSNITKNQQGEVVGMYQTIMQVVYATSSALSGVMGDTFGFEWIMVFAGVLTILSSMAPLVIRTTLK